MNRKLTGFSPLVRKQIQDRSGNICELCGEFPVEQIHHRRPRGAGGTRRPDTNQPANALGVDAHCHQLIEMQRKWSYAQGWLVSQHRTPAEIPVLRRGVWVLLDDAGNYIEIPEPATGGVA